VKVTLAATPARCCLSLAIAAGLAGCSSIDSFLSGDKVDYRAGATKSRPLEVPPDLTQLARDPRYAPQGGVVSASATPTTPALQGGTPTLSSVAPGAAGKVRVEKAGPQRWLVADASPEVLYPEVKAFWEERGFRLTLDNPQAGVMETDWVENRAKLPQDLIRSTLGRLVDRLYDTGERDRFRTRLERGADGTEIYISHRGLEEIYSNEQKDQTVWARRDNDPQLESEFLTRLLMRLALDRGGFSVEDRDRSAGLYYVRYIDPKIVAAGEPNFFAKLFGAKGPSKDPVRYRVVVKGDGAKTTVSVQTSAGAPETGDAGKAIVAQLIRDLR